MRLTAAVLRETAELAGTKHFGRLAQRTATVWRWLVGFAALSVGGLSAQDANTPTLRVYPNLVQVPVLVLGQDRNPTTPIAESRFFVSLDRGPRFRVAHARLEGDDPISLAILLDVEQPDPRLIGKIDDAIAGLAPDYLRPADHVAVYAMDCGLIRSSDDGATDSATLKQHVDLVLKAWKDRAWTPAKDCKAPQHLWDSLVAMTESLSREPGRRVILAVTDGNDRGSKYPFNGPGQLAQERGVAIFGLLRPDDRGLVFGDTLRMLCEETGGIELINKDTSLARQLERFTELVRGRYIVEFPRPVNTKGGHYGMQITIAKSNAFIRPSGIGVPVYSSAVLKDPTTVPLDPSNAPQLGKSRLPMPH
jgi:hypothetical protein